MWVFYARSKVILVYVQLQLIIILLGHFLPLCANLHMIRVTLATARRLVAQM